MIRVYSNDDNVFGEAWLGVGAMLSPFLFYKIDGTYLAGKEIGTAKVYITVEDFGETSKKTRAQWDDIKNRSKELLHDYDNLKEIAAIANGEAWQAEPEDMQRRELFAIAGATINYVERYKTKTVQNLPSNFAYARKDKTAGYMKIKTTSAKDKNADNRLKTAMAAGINALLKRDDSARNNCDNGATFWDGIDVLQNRNHYRYRPHAYYSYLRGIYDPNNLSAAFYINAKTYGLGKASMKELITVDEKVTWELCGETDRSIQEGLKGNVKTRTLQTLDNPVKSISKEQTEAAYKADGHNMWFYPKSICLYEVVAQEGLSIFYIQTDKLNPDEIL